MFRNASVQGCAAMVWSQRKVRFTNKYALDVCVCTCEYVKLRFDFWPRSAVGMPMFGGLKLQFNC